MISPCHECKWFHTNSVLPTCKAFLDLIPPEIISGKNMHTRPVRGDGGITFERIDARERFFAGGE